MTAGGPAQSRRLATNPVANLRPGPGFWLASFAVFMANALLSAARRQWLLAVAQVITGLMAALSAGASMEASAERATRPDGDPVGEA
jgi:hypothetical protein